jgi:hypothetical protein
MSNPPDMALMHLCDLVLGLPGVTDPPRSHFQLSTVTRCKDLKLGVNDLGANPNCQSKRKGGEYKLVPRGPRVVSGREGVA